MNSPLKLSDSTSLPKLPSGLSPGEISQVKTIFSTILSYVDNEEFHKPNPHFRLFKIEVDMTEAELTWYNLLVRYEQDAEIKEPKRNKESIFTGKEEKITFLQMNYAKSVVFKLKQKLELGKSLSLKEIRRMLIWYRIFKQRENTITVANMGLIAAVGHRKKVFNGSDKEVIAAMEDGLLQSISNFDIAKGYKFSTYAWRALLQKSNRVFQKSFERKSRMIDSDFTGEHDPILVIEDFLERKDMNHFVHEIIRSVDSGLDERERQVIVYKFGLDGGIALNSKQISSKLKLSKERVRQICNIALEKLRPVLASEI